MFIAFYNFFVVILQYYVCFQVNRILDFVDFVGSFSGGPLVNQPRLKGYPS